MKYVLLLLLTSSILISCKKEVVPIEQDFSHYNGHFYGELSHYSVYNNSNWNVVSDMVIRSSTDNSQLCFLEEQFSIPDEEMTNFGFSSGNYSGRTFHLNFYNNFNSISYSDDYNYGTSWYTDDTFYGVRMQASETGSQEHPLKAQLEGDFVLNIAKKEYLNNIDTNYYDTLSLTLSGFSAILDSKQFDFPPFHSYVHSNSMVQDLDERRIEDIYWEQDTIYLNYMIISGVFGGTIDTVHYRYSGVRL